jgi:molybdenum cofactor synthesis domain-containing protein
VRPQLEPVWQDRDSHANLTTVAGAVARALGLPTGDVMVIDARDDLLALDVLRTSIDPYRLVGKKAELLSAIGSVDGVEVSERTDVFAEGMLGWLALEEGPGTASLDRSRQMRADVASRIARRALVFATGNEVLTGQIVDTNTPLIRCRLERVGFVVEQGPALGDDRALIEQQLGEAAFEGGYGLVVTTGGVGAETKDCTIEALLGIDPSASTPYICRFEKGYGRHAKDGVRIGVGRAGTAMLLALPGPNDEVALGIDAAIESLSRGESPDDIAGAVVGVLRQWIGKKSHVTHGHGDAGSGRRGCVE